MTRNEVSLICAKLNAILSRLAKEFRPIYENCLKSHASTAIRNEYEFLQLLYPEPMNYNSYNIVTGLDIKALQEDFDNMASSINDRLIGQSMCINDFHEFTQESETYANSHKFFSEFYLYQGLYLNDI